MEIFVVVAAIVINILFLLFCLLAVNDTLERTLKRLSKNKSSNDYVLSYRNGFFVVTQNGKTVVESTYKSSVVDKLTELKSLERTIDTLNSN